MASTVWKGQLAFGLVSFPVRLVRAARKNRIPLRYVSRVADPEPPPQEPEEDDYPSKAFAARNGEREAETPDAPAIEEEIIPVRQAYIPEDGTQSAPARELEKAFEVSPGQFATFRKEELQRLRQPTSPDMQILRSVRMEEIDPVFLETSYYIHPGPAAEHPYNLFYRALHETGYAVLAEVAMHGRQHIVVIRAGSKGLIAHTLYYVDEVRANEEHVTASVEVPVKELSLARQFIEAVASPFQPEEFTDRYKEQLQSLIAAKQPVAARGTESVTPAPGKVVDIMDALRKSLEKVQAAKNHPRKPVARAATAKKTRKRGA